MSQVDGLWRRYKENNDSKAREELILKYSYLAKYAVDRLPVRSTSVIGYDDLLGHAIIGLINAVERFDPAREVKFETYALTRIRGAVLDAIRSLDWIPRSVRSSEQKLRQTMARLETELGRAATDAEIAEELGVSIDDVNETFTDVAQSAILSLEDLIATCGECVPELTCTADDESNPVAAVEAVERKRILADAIAGLPETEKLVISLYYVEGLTLKEIAQVLGVTESRVCQINSKAVVRLHGKLTRHKDLMMRAA